jgi:site-specific recombinase XerD
MPITVKQVTQREHGTEYQTWMVSGYVNGKRIRIRCKSEDEARMRKSEEETKAINSERSTRFIQTRLTAVQLNEAESCFDRLAPKYRLTEAVDYFLQYFHAPDFTITVSEASTKFRGAMEGVIRERTMIQLKSTLGQFERFADGLSVHEITSDTVERFLNSLRAKNGTDKASRKTWNNYRGELHQFFEWCREKPQRYASANPASDTKRFKIDRGHVNVLNVDQCRELLEHVSELKEGRLVRFFALALFAGIRPGRKGELEKLGSSPQLVDLDNKVIRISPAISKTRQSRQIKIRPNLYQWLKRYPGEILSSKSQSELTAIRKKFKLTHDVLRHTFISMHIGAFKSFADAALESGNSEKIIRHHYLNVVPAGQAKAFWNIQPKP